MVGVILKGRSVIRRMAVEGNELQDSSMSVANNVHRTMNRPGVPSDYWHLTEDSRRQLPQYANIYNLAPS